MAKPLQLPLFSPPATWQPPTEFLDLDGCRRIAVDVETKDTELGTLGPGFQRGAYIVGVAVGTDDGRRAYYPVRHEGGGNISEDAVRRWAKGELNRFTGEIVGSHLLYDLEALGTWNITFPNVKAYHDIGIAEPLIDEERFSYGLDALALDYLGQRKVESELREAASMYGWNTSSQVKSNLWRLSASHVGAYAEGDVDLPLRIFPLQYKKLEDEDLLRVYEVERKLIPILLAMRQRGVRIDLDKVNQVRHKMVTERNDILSQFRRLTTPKAEFMAVDSFAKQLWDRGLRYPLTEKTRKPSITQDWIKANKSDPAVALLLRGRGLNTTINTFIDGHLLGHHVNGRIHCEFKQLKDDGGGTIARFSSANPNLQNIPARDEELGPLVRSAFLPEGGELWEKQDQSQVEYRLIVNFAVGEGAEEARQQYRTDPKTDFHKLCATMMGIDPEDKIKRKRVKNVNFAKGYGAGVAKFAEMFGCSEAEAKLFVDEYDRKLPFAKATLEKAAEWAVRRGFVTTILGRRGRFSRWVPKDDPYARPLSREEALKEYGQKIKRAHTHKALSRKIQGSAADVMKLSMVNAWEAGVFDVLGAPLLTVHDELDLSVPRTLQGDEACLELKRLSETCVNLSVPLMVECERGANWGEC